MHIHLLYAPSTPTPTDLYAHSSAHVLMCLQPPLRSRQDLARATHQSALQLQALRHRPREHLPQTLGSLYRRSAGPAGNAGQAGPQREADRRRPSARHSAAHHRGHLCLCTHRTLSTRRELRTGLCELELTQQQQQRELARRARERRRLDFATHLTVCSASSVSQ